MKVESKGAVPVALVTGAGIRVGREIAKTLGASGYHVICHANQSEAAAGELVDAIKEGGGSAEFMGADLSSTEEVLAFVKRVLAGHSEIEVLVNNAGLYQKVSFEEVSLEGYQRMQAVNIEAPFFLTQGLLPALRGSGKGCVVNITDSAVVRPYRGYAPYFVSKAALEALTRVLAIELAPEVRVNGVAPGTVAFPPGFEQEVQSSIRRAIPMGEIGSEADIAEAVLYLVKSATFTTGQILRVDGGRSIA